MGEAWDDYVQVGLITKPHGLRGEVLVRPDTDFPDERFAVGADVFARIDGDIQKLSIRTSRTHQGRPLVSFEGRESLDAVEGLALSELRVPESALTPLPEGEYYWYQFVGTPVVTVDGREVGRVLRVEPTAAAGMLVVAGSVGEVQIPLVPEICLTRTPEQIVVQAPEGLLELNAPTERPREARHRHDLSRDGEGGLRRRRHRARGATRSARPADS